MRGDAGEAQAALIFFLVEIGDEASQREGFEPRRRVGNWGWRALKGRVEAFCRGSSDFKAIKSGPFILVWGNYLCSFCWCTRKQALSGGSFWVWP